MGKCRDDVNNTKAFVFISLQYGNDISSTGNFYSFGYKRDQQIDE